MVPSCTQLCPVHVCAILKEYEIITVIYIGKPGGLDLLCFGLTEGINSLDDPTRNYKV